MLSMKKIFKRLFLGLGIILTLVLLLVVVPYFNNIVMPWDRADAIEAALEWGGLMDLPKSSNDISVDTEGGMFTREFIIEFNCDKNELNEWIEKSGLNNIDPIKQENGISVYRVPGHGGSIGGLVYIDRNKNNVIIDMSWS